MTIDRPRGRRRTRKQPPPKPELRWPSSWRLVVTDYSTGRIVGVYAPPTESLDVTPTKYKTLGGGVCEALDVLLRRMFDDGWDPSAVETDPDVRRILDHREPAGDDLERFGLNLELK